jgi:hypothetical protein
VNITAKYDRSNADICGRAESLRDLSKALHELVGSDVYSLAVPSSPPAPYLGYAQSLKIGRSQGNVCVSRSADVIAIVGSPEKLAILAHNIESLADQTVSGGSNNHSEHLHIEYYAGHPYLKDESLPLVITKRAFE